VSDDGVHPRRLSAGGPRPCGSGSRPCGPGNVERLGCRTRRQRSSKQRVLAFALGHPGCGPNRIAAGLARPKWGGVRRSPNGVWRALSRHGLNTRARRLGLIAGDAAPPDPSTDRSPSERHLQVSWPGELVQLDCFGVRRLHRTRGATAPSTWAPRGAGPSCTPAHPNIPRPDAPWRWPDASRRTSHPEAGHWRRS